jgi:DnaK suppressor protein
MGHLKKITVVRDNHEQNFPHFVRPMYVCKPTSLFFEESFSVTRSSSNPKHRRFEDRLRQQQRHLENSMLTAVTQGRQAVAEDTLDVADQAVLSYQKEMMFTQGTEGHSQLSLVRLALERLHEGSFGDCLHCGRPIGEKRLEALPWTPYCIDCQEKVENGEIEDVVRAA